MRTRNLLWLVLALTLFSYGFTPEDKGWENTKNKAPLTGATASKINTFDASDPESVARFFYASRIRRNSEWKKVVGKLESEWTIKMKAAMNAYAQWTFKKVTLQKVRHLFDSEVHIILAYEATVKGKPKKGTGEMTVQRVNGKWQVHEVPY